MTRQQIKQTSNDLLKVRRRILTDEANRLTDKYGSNMDDPTYKRITTERRLITREINSRYR